MEYLHQKNHKAVKWIVCMRKMGLFQLGLLPDGTDVEIDNETQKEQWHDFCRAVAATWAIPDLTPEDDDAKTVWVDRVEQLLSNGPTTRTGRTPSD